MPQESGLRKGYVSRTKLVHIMGRGGKNISKKTRKNQLKGIRESRARWVYIFDEDKNLINEIKGVSYVAEKLKLKYKDIQRALSGKSILDGHYFSYNQFFEDPSKFI